MKFADQGLIREHCMLSESIEHEQGNAAGNSVPRTGPEPKEMGERKSRKKQKEKQVGKNLLNLQTVTAAERSASSLAPRPPLWGFETKTRGLQ